MTLEHERRLQELISCYRSRFGEMLYDWDKVEEKLYDLIADIEKAAV